VGGGKEKSVVIQLRKGGKARKRRGGRKGKKPHNSLVSKPASYQGKNEVTGGREVSLERMRVEEGEKLNKRFFP